MPFGYIPNKTPWKNALLKVFGLTNTVRRLQAPIIMRMLDPREEDVVLDVGCGNGAFAYEIAKKCFCIGIDWFIGDNLFYLTQNSSGVSFLQADVQNLPFSDNVFDKILLSSVLQMVENDDLLIKECNRVLKENGIMVLSVPLNYIFIKALNNEFRAGLMEKYGVKGKGFYKYDELVNMLQARGFEVLETEYAPKKLGSFIHEIWLYFCYRFGLPLSHPIYFVFLYPLALLDKLGSKKQKGYSIIINARKKTTLKTST